MEATEEVKKARRGNPMFGKKPKKDSQFDPKKRYQFQLVQSYEAQKPRDKDTGEIIGNPYPPYYMIPSSGVALDPETNEVRRWRYVHGYNSIWIEDQQSPEPTKQQLDSAKNDLVFREGSLFVNGADKAKMNALLIQDIYADKENKLEAKNPVFKLIDENANIMKIRSSSDDAYNAEKMIREASYDALLPIAMVLGIDTSKVEDEDDEEVVRTQLILQARGNSAVVMRELTDPKNEVKYEVQTAINSGRLKVEDGKLMWSTGVAILSVDMQGDVAEQAARAVLKQDKEAMKMYDQLRTQ